MDSRITPGAESKNSAAVMTPTAMSDQRGEDITRGRSQHYAAIGDDVIA